MRTIDLKSLTDATNSEFDSSWGTLPPVSHRSYHELSDRPVVEVDALSQLEGNVLLLEDLQARMSFLMREVRSVLKA